MYTYTYVHINKYINALGDTIPGSLGTVVGVWGCVGCGWGWGASASLGAGDWEAAAVEVEEVVGGGGACCCSESISSTKLLGNTPTLSPTMPLHHPSSSS